MGNKHKQKALLVVLIAIVSALAIFPFVLHLKTAFSFKVNAATEYDKTGTTKGEISNTSGSYNISLDSGKYMFIIAGGDGSGTSNYGYGATSLAFFTGSKITEGGIDMDKTSFTNGNNGGGWTNTYSNFAIPNGKSAGFFFAGGGGGAGSDYSDGAQHHAQFYTYGSTTNDSTQGGIMRADGTGKQGTIKYPSGYYNGVYNFSYSIQGPNVSIYSERGVIIKETKTWREKIGGTSQYPLYNTKYKTSYIYGGHGGAGRTSSGDNAWGGGGGNSGFRSYAGGGGVGTQNGYPIYAGDCYLGVRSSGRGYLKYYRIDPATFPSANDGSAANPATIKVPSGVGDGRYTPGSASADAFGNDVLDTYIKTAWVYSTDNSTWTTDASSIKNDALGTSKTVYCKYVIYGNRDYIYANSDGKVYPCYNMKYSTAADAAKDDNYTIATKTINLIKYDSPTYTVPTAKSGVVFTNESQELINPGSATNGTMYYKLTNGSTMIVDWTEDVREIKATAGSEYTVSYYIKGNTNYSDLGSKTNPLGAVTVKIAKADPQLNRGTLKPKANVIYNGAYQQVFEGRVAVGNSVLNNLSQGSIYYACNTSPINEPNKDGSTEIEKEQERDAFYQNGSPYIIYMWYRMEEGPYNEAVPWKLLTDDEGVPITNQIQPANLTVTPTIVSENYNGRESGHQLIKDVKFTSNSPSLVNNFEVTYIQEVRYINDVLIEKDIRDNYTDFCPKKAGKYYYYATWKVKDEVSDPYNYVIQEMPHHLATGYIYQIDNTDSNIAVLGVPTKEEMQDKYKIKISGGEAYPFDACDGLAVDITVCGTDADNMITSQKSYGDTPELKNINRLAFALSKNNDPNAVPEGDWVESASATDLNEQIKNAAVDKPGWWYLHFKVLQHFNLKTGTTFNGTSFLVYPGDLKSDDLTGIIMAGNPNEHNIYQITFDGTGHKIAVSGSLKTKDSVGIALTGVKYACNNTSVLAPGKDSSEWKENLSDLADVSAAGTYYLWVKWEDNEQISSTSGVIYGAFEITPFDAEKSQYLTFSGGDFDDNWNNDEEDPDSTIYRNTYQNKSIPFGEMINPEVKVLDNTSIKLSHFGSLMFNYGTSTAPNDGNFVPADRFAELKVKNVGVYYIWVKWSGNTNTNGISDVISGQALYKTNDIHFAKECVFVIDKLRNAEKVYLRDNDFVSANGNGMVEYAYYFDTVGEICATVGEAQPLFTPKYSPVVIIDGAVEPYTGYPDGSIQYLLSKYDTGVTAGDVGWSNAVSFTMATDVGEYYLWVKIAINDNNLDIVKIIRLDKTARIVAVESPVHYCSNCEPTAVLDGNGNSIEADGEAHILINPGNQINPSLEYSLDGETWFTNHEAITGTDAGRYTVYYRGADYSNIFYAVDKDPTEYKYVDVFIESPGVKFKPYPESLNVKYNGQPQLIFSESYAYYIEEEMEVVYSWDNTNYYTYEEFSNNTALMKTNVGRYTLWVDVIDQEIQGYKGCEPRNVTVEILKADIQVSQPVFYGGDFVYKGADYQLLSSDVDYGMIGSDKNFIEDVNGTTLSYLNRNNAFWLGGNMGKIWYIATMSKEEVPGENDGWKESFSEVTARNAGNYYIWVKVEAGDYHNGLAATCWNPINPIVINPLDNPDNKQYIVADGSSYAAITGLSYTGVEQKLINALDLKVNVVNRDKEGNVVINDGQVSYNSVDSAELGSIYFTLIKQGDHIPDELSDDWVLGWDSIGQVNAGTYHLCVMIKSDNFAEPVQFNLSVIIDNAHEIKIKPAAKNALQVSGITSVGTVYTAAGQVLATGNLIVKIGEQDITNTDIIKTQFAYAAVGIDDFSALNWSDNLNEAMVTEVGEYQLYVKLSVTGNISKSETLIFPVFSEDNLASIVRTSAVKIIAPEFDRGLVYNGNYQSLIKTDASLQMADDKIISGEIGAPTYYISSSAERAIIAEGTTKEGAPLKLNEVQELHAGIYHIYVAFAQGTSHEAVSPTYVNSVTIAQASVDNIELSGIEFIKNNTYNGTNHQLISAPVKQTIIAGGLELNNSHYAKVEYAYSTDPDNQPSTGWVEGYENLTARNAGTYYVWVKVTGVSNGVTLVNNIANYTKCYYLTEDDCARIHTARLGRENLEGVSPYEDLVYTSESQVLASTNGVKIYFESNQTNLNTPEYNNNLAIQWALSEDKTIMLVDGWVSDISKLTGTNAGDYHLWIKIQGSNNFYNFEGYYGTVTIGKGSIAFTAEPGTRTDLSYIGSSQELINNGPIAKFDAKGQYYDDNNNELKVEYSLDGQDWTQDYKEIKGIDAIEYEVFYRVIAGENWNESEISSIKVSISPVDASSRFGLVEAPEAKEGIHYNEEAQDLISFGTLSTLVEGERGAAWEGSRIVFWYADAEDQKYEYYFNGEEYVWDEANGKLPGKTDVGTYTIRYYITRSINDNFCDSAEDFISVSIAKRQVEWYIAPQPVNNFRHTGEYQRIVVPGQLNIGITDPESSANAKGVTIWYSRQNPAKAELNDWTKDIPMVNKIGLFSVWYYVEVDKNNEFNGEETSPEKAICLTTIIERNMLSIVDAPRPETLNYTATPQSLVNYYYLSTDATDAYGEKAPFIEYSFDLDAEKWTREITETSVGEYTIYYRLNYDPVLFVFEGNNGQDKDNPLSITAKITPARFATDSIQAECIEDENGKHYVTYKVGMTSKYNEETGEIEEVPLYTQELMGEVEDENSIVYYYRKNDIYHQGQNWAVWENGVTKLTDMANYEFKLEIIAPENQDVNFVSYEQEGTVAAYLRYVYIHDIKIKVVMENFNTPAYVRYWIDFDGSMKYEDEATAFKKEGYVSRNGTLEDTFQYVYSNGYKNGAQIRLEAVNQNTYYYVSDRRLTDNERRNLKLETQDLNSADKGFNVGLLNYDSKVTIIYLYEVYHIQYDNNNGIGDSLTDGWKWHNLDYRLEENKYKKFINGDYLEPNGWNTSRSGNGNSYNGASMTYRENSSQIFYAKFFGQDEKFYTISWVIYGGGNRYTLSRDFRVWFDASNPSYENRTTGTLVLEGDLITLPQVEVDEFGESLAEIFGGYVLGWHTADDETPYTIGMTAVRNMTFIAELNSDLDDYVQAEFINADEQTVHESGKFASGAEAYMALSGMDVNLIKDYQEGFDKWVDKYGYDYLDRTSATDGIFTYQLGTKTVPNTDTANQDLTWADYMPMFIILAVGIIPLVACLIGYLIIRNKQHKKINQAN